MSTVGPVFLSERIKERRFSGGQLKRGILFRSQGARSNPIIRSIRDIQRRNLRSRHESNTVKNTLSGETQQAEDAVQKLKQAFWCANSCFNDMWAYQQEENQARREFLKKAYEDITGF